MNNSIIIRPVTLQDLGAVEAISKECFKDPWDPKSLEEEVKTNESSHLLLAEKEGEILGYVHFWQVLDEGHIMNVAVTEKARGQHIGTLLVDAMLNMGTPLGIFYWTLEVRVSNVPAIKLYENAGFVSAGRRPNYYSHPKEDAFIYWLKLEE